MKFYLYCCNAVVCTRNILNDFQVSNLRCAFSLNKFRKHRIVNQRGDYLLYESYLNDHLNDHLNTVHSYCV